MSLTAARSDCVFAPEGSGDRSEQHVRSETGPERYGLLALRTLGSRHGKTTDTRHTDATVFERRDELGVYCPTQRGLGVQNVLSISATQYAVRTALTAVAREARI